MRTVKQVSRLTGVSIRALQYYDEIGLLRPSKVTDAGYRMYDNDALEVLQQILFFKELDFQLKDIKRIMESPDYDKKKAFQNQKKWLTAKRDRLDNLLNLLDKLIKGEKNMSFKEFDLSGYFQILKEFREGHADEIIRQWGSLENFDRMTDTFKAKEPEIAQMAIKQYGSIEKYTEAMRKQLSHFSDNVEKLQAVRDKADEYMQRTNEIAKRIVSNMQLGASAEEVQQAVAELMEAANEHLPNIDMGDHYWQLVAQAYLTEPEIIKVTDRQYGDGASHFIGGALQVYLDQHE